MIEIYGSLILSMLPDGLVCVSVRLAMGIASKLNRYVFMSCSDQSGMMCARSPNMYKKGKHRL